MKKTKTKRERERERKATKRVFRQECSLSSFRHITTAFSVLVVVFTSFVSTTTHFTPFTMTYHYSYSYYYHHHQQQHHGCSNCRFQSNQQIGSYLNFIQNLHIIKTSALLVFPRSCSSRFDSKHTTHVYYDDDDRGTGSAHRAIPPFIFAG